MKKSILLLSSFILMTLVANSQVTRNIVIVEIATGTWTKYSPGAAMGADELVAN